jgi:hypothetical protein
MKQLTPEEIQHNWGNLRQLIDATFSGERLERLNEMYDFFEERMCLAPASGREHFHNAHPGGYVEHVLHITQFSYQIYKLWKQNGATIDNFTVEELLFAALHHDLGKVGNLVGDNYIENDSDWHRKNQGLIYKHNPKIDYMTITDRACWILQHFGVKMTETEFIGMRLADGLYEEANKSYYMNWSKDNQLSTNLAYILHQADMMASKIEYDQWARGDHDLKVDKVKEEKKKTEQSKAANQAFKELFGE